MRQEAFVVTGGAGFVGSNLVRALNKKGFENIIIVDSLTKKDKWRNLVDLKFIDFFNYHDNIASVIEQIAKYDVKGIFHIGANADVSVADGNHMLNLNFIHSKGYFNFAKEYDIPFIYASSSAVYGNSNSFIVDGGRSEKPHNVYALSKWMFDNYVRHNLSSCTNKVIGFRFFNVFGLGEFHKGKNASLPYRFCEFIKTKGYIDLFEGADTIVRDYIGVNDLVRTLLYTMDNNVENGIYNLGSGTPFSHSAIAQIVVEIMQQNDLSKGKIEEYIKYIPFPEDLKKIFQFYTCAQDLPEWMKKLNFIPLEQGIRSYIQQLIALDRGE